MFGEQTAAKIRPGSIFLRFLKNRRKSLFKSSRWGGGNIFSRFEEKPLD
jgi:hypothetical protein